MLGVLFVIWGWGLRAVTRCIGLCGWFWVVKTGGVLGLLVLLFVFRGGAGCLWLRFGVAGVGWAYFVLEVGCNHGSFVWDVGVLCGLAGLGLWFLGFVVFVGCGIGCLVFGGLGWDAMWIIYVWLSVFGVLLWCRLTC